MITREQELQMTTINADNVFPIGVSNCPDGGDDLDLVLAEIFSDNDLREKLNLSSVNSINWCRVMVQSIHYIYSYLKIANSLDEKIPNNPKQYQTKLNIPKQHKNSKHSKHSKKSKKSKIPEISKKNKTKTNCFRAVCKTVASSEKLLLV